MRRYSIANQQQTLPPPQSQNSPPFTRSSFIIPSLNDPRPSFSFLSLDFTNPSTPNTNPNDPPAQSIQPPPPPSSHQQQQQQQQLPVPQSQGLPLQSPLNKIQSVGNIYQSYRRPEVSDPAHIELLTNQYESLKQKVNELQFEISKKCDQFSLLITDNGDNLVKFNENIICSGTFTRVNYWTRDQLMNLILNNLRKINQIYDPNSIKPMSINFHSSGNENVFKDLTNQVSLINNKFLNFNLSINQILNMLPPRDIIFYHLDQFFKLVYPFIPILDEKSFKSNILNILNIKSQFNHKLIKIYISILVIILRLSYTITLLNINLSNEPIDNKVLSYPINADYILIVKTTIFDADLLTNSNISFVQLLLMYRFYQVNSPENGDGESGNNGLLINDFLVSSVKSLSLNRNLDNVSNDRTYIQLLRKLWWCTGALDIDHAMIFGRVPSIDVQMSDSTGPLFDPFSSNLQNVELEKFSIDRLNKFAFFSKDISHLLKSLHCAPDVISSDSVELQLNNLTRLVYESCDNTNVLFRGKMFKYSSIENDICNQVDDFRVIIMVFTMKSVIEYYLLIHYEKTNNVFKFVEMIQKYFNSWVFHVHKLQSVIKAMDTNLSTYRILLGHMIVESIFKMINIMIPIVVRIKMVKYQIEIYSKSIDVIPDIPKPMNYNPFTHPDPNPLNKNKLPLLIEFKIKLIKFIRDQLMILKNLSIWIYKGRRYYRQSKCILDLIEKGDILTFDKIIPGTWDWNNNLLMSVDEQVLNVIVNSTDWNLQLPNNYEYFEDEFGVDIWSWGKVDIDRDEEDEFESIL